MAEFKLPDLGENIESGEVINVLVAEGDALTEDQPVIELETDKAVIEVPSTVSGTVSRVLVAEGDRAQVGQVILTVEESGADAVDAAPAAEPPAAAPAPEQQLQDTAEPVAAAAADGAAAPPPQESSPAPAGGLDAADGDGPAETAPAAAEPEANLIPAAPSVRRLAREIGVDIGRAEGTGPGGRISEEDVKALSRRLHESPPAAPGAAAAAPLPDFSRWGEIEVEPFSNVRRITAQRMAAAWSAIPHVTQHDQADITALEAWRKGYAPQVEKAGAKLTPTAILLKVAASALRAFPAFNASIDMAGEQIIFKSYVHIGVAVDTPRGLLVPVIRDVDRKSVTEISLELGEMAERTRTGKVAVADLEGGTFTVSNLGGLGGTAFTPIVNAPEVAILGAARSRTEPVYVDGELQPRLILPLSLSYDHRLIDGADGVRFLRYLCQGLENPWFLAFEG
ncbi:MAG: 2-oxo acid dehydrogenase subunit E2 [Gemmatimonadaceae bacterium]|nr:2-oxo acid dehydrogenase subunit E2 [Gemmatimonadaceae bacterium]